jgi:hypothetical protein
MIGTVAAVSFAVTAIVLAIIPISSAAVIFAVVPVPVPTVCAVIPIAPIISAMVVAISALIIAAPIVAISVTIVMSVVPRADADENSVDEVIGAVIAIRRAGVRGIVIVTIGASGWRTVVAGTDTDGDMNLRVGRSCGQHENSKQSQIF